MKDLKLFKFSLLLITLMILASCSRPMAKFAMQKEGKVAPTKVKFENQSENAESYLWDFGDGSTSEEESPSHKYYLSGKYDIKLAAKKGNKVTVYKNQIIVEAPKECLVELETTLGTMTLKLYDLTPKHRDNFIKLAEENYYDGILFHRVIDGFMIQGGDPNSKGAGAGARLGSGGPGYQVDAEFNESLHHFKGTLAAARQGDFVNPQKMSSGSQFYIVDGKEVTEDMLNRMEAQKGITYSKEARDRYIKDGGTPFLDQEYTIFGEIVEGMDVIAKIAKVKTDGADRPMENVMIISAKVIK